MSSAGSSGPMGDGPHEIGRLQAGRDAGDVLAVAVDCDDVLIGHPSGWPMRLNVGARYEFRRLWAKAESKAEAWQDEPAEVQR